MPKEYINPASLFASQELGFSQAVATSGAARTLYVSGQTAWDADGRIVGMDLAAQTSQAFRNVDAAVKAGGGTIDDVVSLRIYVVGLGDDSAAAAVGKGLREAFSGSHKPATTWIGVASLARPEFLIEIEATAVIDSPLPLGPAVPPTAS